MTVTILLLVAVLVIVGGIALVFVVGSGWGDPGGFTLDIRNRRADAVIVELTGTEVDTVVEATPGRTLGLLDYRTRDSERHELRFFTVGCQQLGVLVVEEWGWIDVPPEGIPVFHQHGDAPTPQAIATPAASSADVPSTPEPSPLSHRAGRAARACTDSGRAILAARPTPFAPTPRPAPEAVWRSPVLPSASSIVSVWPEDIQAWARVVVDGEPLTLRSVKGAAWQRVVASIPDDVRIVASASGWAGSVTVGERNGVLLTRSVVSREWVAIDPAGSASTLIAAVVGPVPVVLASSAADEDGPLDRLYVRVSAADWAAADPETFDGGEFVAAAATRSAMIVVTTLAGSSDRVIWHSSDGLAWERLQVPRLQGATIEHIAALGRGFVTLAWRGGWEAWRVDPSGSECRVVDPPDGLPSDRDAVIAMVAFGDGLAAIGRDDAIVAVWLSSGGSKWLPQALPDESLTQVDTVVATDEQIIVRGSGSDGAAVLIGHSR